MTDILPMAQPIGVSGLYTRREWVASSPTGGFLPVVTDSVRLDVDGSYPLFRASGTFQRAGALASVGGPVHWISDRLEPVGPETWEATIHRRFPEPAAASPLPHTSVRIHVPATFIASVVGARMTLTFFGGAPDVVRMLEFASPYFRTAEFEFDRVETATRVTSIDTWAHPEHPAGLRNERLSLTEVFSRAGVEVLQSPHASMVGLEAGVGAENWNDQQLHDCMQVFWSRFAPRAQWALWTLFANRHVNANLNGIMFDSWQTDPNDAFQRQGAAVFSDTIADHLPSGEEHPAEWIARRRFFTAAHEIGHAFNLLHSDEKALGIPWDDSVRPNPLAGSFMNRPEGDAQFWWEFKYRFDDRELFFIRHAPESFVEMGNAAAGTDHGDRVGRFAPNPHLALELSVSRPRAVFEFLEPVNVELKLTNTGPHPQLVDPAVLDEIHHVTLTIQPRGGAARAWRPYARHCYFPRVRVLHPGESLATSVFASAGLDGWHLAEPGSYTLQARLPSAGGEVLARPLTLRVAAPRGAEEDALAQSFFTDEVGRALAFGGTHVMTGAVEALEEAAGRLRGRAVARHAELALGLPWMTDRRVLRLPPGPAAMMSAAAAGGTLATVPARPDEARRRLRDALANDDGAAAETFGHLAHRRLVAMYADWLEACGDGAAAHAARGHPAEAHAPPPEAADGDGPVVPAPCRS